MYGVGRLRPTSITNYQARKVTHCHINVNVCYWPVAVVGSFRPIPVIEVLLLTLELG